MSGRSGFRGALKWVPAFAGMTVVVVGSAAVAQGERPGRWLADARGRVHVHDAQLAQVRNWRDLRDCTSTFELVREGTRTAQWRIDWKRVRNVQISTRRHFNTDVEEATYREQPGLILYGRLTTRVEMPGLRPAEHDTMEFFLKDVSRMDYAYRGLLAYSRACRR